jgi:hypothetical protein
MVERIASAHDAQSYAESIFRTKVGDPITTSVIPNSRNYLFRIGSLQGGEYVVKVYARTSELIGNCEEVAYARLKGNSFVRQCLGIDRGQAGTPAWAIMEYVHGATLLDSIERLQTDPELERRLIGEIVHFIRECVTIGMQGYGDIGSQFHGERATWPDFLDHYLRHLGESVLKVENAAVRELMERGLECLQRFRAREDGFLRSRPAPIRPRERKNSK